VTVKLDDLFTQIEQPERSVLQVGDLMAVSFIIRC
jgi:hypothetical protein